MPLPFVGLSLQSLPLTMDRLLSFEAALLPCSYRPTCQNVLLFALLPSVSSTPTSSRGCLIPLTTMNSLFTNRGPLPGCPGLVRQIRFFLPASSASKLLSPLQVRSQSHRVAPRRLVVALLGFVPFAVFSFHAFESSTRSNPKIPTLLSPEGSARD